MASSSKGFDHENPYLVAGELHFYASNVCLQRVQKRFNSLAASARNNGNVVLFLGRSSASAAALRDETFVMMLLSF